MLIFMFTLPKLLVTCKWWHDSKKHSLNVQNIRTENSISVSKWRALKYLQSLPSFYKLWCRGVHLFNVLMLLMKWVTVNHSVLQLRLRICFTRACTKWFISLRVRVSTKMVFNNRPVHALFFVVILLQQHYLHPNIFLSNHQLYCTAELRSMPNKNWSTTITFGKVYKWLLWQIFLHTL